MSIDALKFPLGLFTKKIKYSVLSFVGDSIAQTLYLVKWLTPGLAVKRWLAINFIGMMTIALGINYLAKLLVVNYEIATGNCSWGIMTIALGMYLSVWGQVCFARSITQPFKSEGDLALIDLLLTHNRLQRGAKIVAVGGGTGLSSLLRGLKHYTNNLTAVVTVADDGGSSGRLRKELGVLPPGDIRNCITALAKEESLLSKLFEYRFSAGEGLKGHSFGNLFLTAMSEITGNLETAIAACSKILAVRGDVLPATLADVNLWAQLEGGQIVTGECNIAATEGKIDQIGCIPSNPKALPRVIQAIKSADCIVLGPGSLYTSIIPNLLVPEICEAIATAKVPRIYVCNIMTQPGETDGYSVSDHLKAIDRACGRSLFDAVLVNVGTPSPQAIALYALQGSHPVVLDREQIEATGRRVILADILDEDFYTHHIRHHSSKLAQQLSNL